MKNTQHCLNCQSELNEGDVFCSNCGQRVDNNVLKIKVIWTEFYENYLSLDTRLGRSIVPFLFKPGFLTKEFVQGRRVSYLNPFRFYLFISIFFFFTLGLVVNQQTDQAKAQLLRNAGEKKDQVGTVMEAIDSLNISDSLLNQDQLDSIIAANGLQEQLNITQSTEEEETQKKGVFVNLDDGGLKYNVDLSQLKPIQKYRYDFNYTDESLLDSIGYTGTNSLRRRMALQTIKLYRSDTKSVLSFMIGNLSFAMLVLIPSMALLLLLFYRKNRMPFVAHLIHSFHLHTLFLFIYGIALIGMYFYDYTPFLVLTFLLTTVYMLFSLKRVYNKGWKASIFRVLFVGFFYYIVWQLTFVSSFLISFLIF